MHFLCNSLPHVLTWYGLSFTCGFDCIYPIKDWNTQGRHWSEGFLCGAVPAGKVCWIVFECVRDREREKWHVLSLSTQNTLDFHCMSAFQEIICSMFYNSSSLKTVSPEMIIHNQSVISYCEELLYFNCRFSLVKCKLRLLPRNPWSGWDSSPSGVRRACWLSDTWTGNEVALCAPAGCKQKLSSWIQHLASLWRCRHQ